MPAHRSATAHRCEMFITIVSMASNNLGSYKCLITLLNRKVPKGKDRNIKIVQQEIFEDQRGGVFEKQNKSP